MQTEYASTYNGCRASTLESHQHVVERAILAMREHIDTSFSLQGMAKSAMCSPFHFNRVFHQMVGITPGHFLSALRLQAAKRLLLTTSMSVIDVCFEAGYNSLGTFSTRFTHLVGLPPFKLRKLGSNLKHVEQLVEKLPIHQVPDSNPSVRGRVTAPEDFEGLVFVGLFREPIPQGAPVSCAYLQSCGDFQLPPVPDGLYYIFVAGQPWSEPVLGYLLSDKMLRGSLGPVPVFVKKGMTPQHVEIRLRPEHLTDPPILLALPFLIDLQKG
jgi:AraC family transcriptional regulator